MKRLAIHFARFGPYHLARIDAATRVLAAVGWEVVGLETSGSDATYAWREERGETGWERRTVFPGEVRERIPAVRKRAGMTAALDELRPDAVAIAGWGSSDARACLAWCRKQGAKAILMSETREADGRRVWWKELLKSRIVHRFDAALVGGRSHRDYLVKLGMGEERVRFGYNVVNNGYFAEQAAEETRNAECGTRNPYFLASNRFIERKNLARLVEAYAQFLNRPSTIDHQPSAWDLCLLGDGELKRDLMTRCRSLNLNVVEGAPWETGPESAILLRQGSEGQIRNPQPNGARQTAAGSPEGEAGGRRRSAIVYFPGFRQIEELPRFYAQAGCFIHPALEEPWGLVLNEAMACGLPVLSGDNAGAAEELVAEGVNGWTFDATRVDEMAACLERIVSLSDDEREAFGRESARILEECCPVEAFGRGLLEALQA